ncbi:MAG TPA: hypothetical protein VMU57_02645 [Edaphobacter sp.]|uniref:hypothetical protein n=1 Tax=Edaphobacter sp. TaxID=1934404 RepID=UPI002CB9D90E|nr:hypothetical protein [Edaphobacter sp.]HUZ93788.1 hypothetical protein [Edaphobacter sp.]
MTKGDLCGRIGSTSHGRDYGNSFDAGWAENVAPELVRGIEHGRAGGQTTQRCGACLTGSADYSY